ncbi:butyrophilin subfamily 3 member A2-like [Seriola lalandi dorsalis]|uniref:Butyrophilin subfamily 3 member A2-like n=1 Tax=Seriola lalandi dorsalis TaxID=1841481 RepID=A0A3B4WTW7_SERLL|nr:butyrophilin subfamily 3 member A2-like [Seriola lalandi dorsalis]
MIGDDVILPCHLKPAADAAGMTFEWARPDLKPRFVHVWHKNQELHINQHQSFKGRTSVDVNKLKHGDISLELCKVKMSDNGIYRCFFPHLGKDSTVQLVVGTTSSLVMSLAGIDRSKSGAVLHCESKGWHPEPELLWLDGEGKLLSAGPTETVRGPDDLYTVSSRVTVEKRHSNNFTCRVQQKIINQSRETQIHVPDDFFVAPCSSAAHITISLVACFVTVLAVVLSVWKWRRNKNKTETNMILPRENHQLMAENEKIKDTEMKMAEIAAELQRNKEDMVGILMKQKEEFTNQKDKLTQRKKKMEELLDANETQLQSLEKETDDTKCNNTTGYLKLEEITSNYRWGLIDGQEELEKLVLNAEKLLQTTESLVRAMEKKEVENMEGKQCGTERV